MPHTGNTLFETLIATAIDGVVVMDARGTVELYSPACERLFGYVPDEVLGRNVDMLMPDAERDAQDNYLERYARTGRKHVIGMGRDVMGQRKDGSSFPLHLSVGENGAGDDKRFVGFIRDLSGRDSAREELLARIVQSSDDAILSKSLDGVILSWNRAAERIFGYSAAEAVGRNITMLIPPDRIAEENDIIAQLRAGQEIDHFETVRVHKGGAPIHASISVSPVRDDRGVVVGASKIVRDISDRRRAEARLNALQADLAHVTRLNAMGQLSSAISHELNQPLTAITNYVKAASRTLERHDTESVARARDIMEKASIQVLRAGAIIRNLREFVEKRESGRVPHDLNAVIEEAVELGLAGTAHHGIEVTLHLDRALAPVMIDKVQIQQVLMNLIRNAVEAMQRAARRELTITSSAESADCAEVIVRDSGPGLSPAVRARLFEPFTTTKENGMGIGLTICRTILEAHGGRIDVVSDGSSGAAFHFRVPFAAQRGI